MLHYHLFEYCPCPVSFFRVLSPLEAQSLRQTQQRRQGRDHRRRRQKTLLPVPMLRCGLVERLGAVTTLCMLDEDTVCQPTSAIKEIFLVDSKVSVVVVALVLSPFSRQS